MPAICLGNIDHAAVRSLLSNRCFSKAGLTINDSVTQSDTVTIGGVKHDGDIVTVTIDGVDYAHEVIAGNADLAAVATAVAALVDANANVAAAAVGAVITVSASVASRAYTISAAVTGADNTVTATVARVHTSVHSVETDNAVSFGIDGHAGTIPATADIVVGGGVLPASSYRWYLVEVGTTGAVTAHEGENNVAFLPDIPLNKAPIGAFKVVTDSTHTFTPGTTALNATGITTTYYDLSCVPAAGVPG